MRLHAPDAATLARSELADCARSRCGRVRELSLLVGYLALSDGDAAGAEAQLRSQPPPPELGAHQAYLLGQALFYRRSYRAAADAFSHALSQAPTFARRRWEQRWVEAELLAGRPALMLELLGLAGPEELSPELLLQRADAYARLQSRDAARRDWRAFLLRHPAHTLAPEVEARWGPTFARLVRWTFDERFARATRLLDAGKAEASLAEVTETRAAKLASTPLARARLALLEAQALLSLGRDEQAEAALRVAGKGPRLVAANAAMLRARRVMRGDDREKARALFEDVARRFRKEDVAEEAAYLIGWLLLQQGRHGEAADAFQKFMGDFPRSRQRADAAWFRGLALIHAARHVEAREVLRELVRTSGQSTLVPQARYWAARSAQLTGVAAEVWTGEYQELVRLYPGTLYGVFAARRLVDAGQPRPVLFARPPRPPPASSPPPELAIARALGAAGLAREAGDALSHLSGRVRGTSDALSLGGALLELGEFGTAHSLAARVLWGAGYASGDPGALALLYPRAYRSAVEDASRRFGTDPFLVWALMRRESGFVPEVSSAVDARGLLQLMPATARRVASELGKPPPHPDMLFAPALNIELATSYVAALQKRFGHPVLIAAAYNAGPKAVLRWLETSGSEPLDLFVEDISFKETRNYVKQVLPDLFLYRSFYGGGEAAFPAWELPKASGGVDY